MPISSSRQRLMPEPVDKPSPHPGISVPARTKKHRKANQVVNDTISLPRIGLLQIDEQERKELSLMQQRTFSSPYGTNPNCTTQPATGRKKRDQERLKDIAFRKIRIFNRVPAPEPLTLIFSSHDEAITHREVLDALLNVRDISSSDIISIQFVDMNVVLGSAGVPGRWLIRVKSQTACRLLLGSGLTVGDDRIFLRRYDDVNAEDYNAYMKRKALLSSDEHNEIQKLLSTNTSVD